MKKTKLVTSLAFIILSTIVSANDEEKIDDIMRLPKACHEGSFERMVLQTYYDYVDLNNYLIHIHKEPVFCVPKKFSALDLIPLVGAEMKNQKYSYSYSNEITDVGKSSIYAERVAAILINTFPCEKEKNKL